MIFTLSLFLSRLPIIVRGLLPLFLLFCLLDVRFQQGILSQVSPRTLVAISLHNLPMYLLVFREYHLLSGYFSLIYPLDLLGSARHSPDQSDSYTSLVFDICWFIFSIVHFSFSWFSVNSILFLKSNTSFLTSSIYCLVIDKFPLIRSETFFLVKQTLP